MKQWKTKGLGALLALFLTVALAGCGAAGTGGGTPSPTTAVTPSGAPVSTAPTAAPAAAKAVYPLTIKDATGKEFTFEKAPERIVSVSPAETEALFALGLGDKIVGVSDYDDYPAEAVSKPKMGSITKPTVEALLAAKADIVFTGVSMKAATVEELRKVGINIFKVEPKTFDDVVNNLKVYGQITGAAEQADKLVADMNAKRQKVADAVKGLKPEEKKKVYLEFSPGWTVGKGEFMDELVAIAGGVNIASEANVTGWSEINEETIIKSNPNVVLFSKDIVDDKSKKTLEQIIRERSGWSKIDAIANNQLFGLDTNLLSRPGPRMADGLLEMAKTIYPNLVK